MLPLVIDIRRAEDMRDVVHRAVQALAEEKIVAFPTETVYGLAATAHSETAVARLLDVKGRAKGQALTLAVKSADDALDYVPHMSPLARRLTRRCWPGPVTLVLEVDDSDSLVRRLPEAVRQAISPSGTIGLRVPAHQMVQDVLRMVAGPIVLSSANRSGEPDAISAEDVVSALGDRVQMVLDDGPSRYGQPSSVVKINGNKFELLRQGVVTEPTLRRLASFVLLFVCTGNTCRSPMAEVMCRKLLAERLGCEPSEVEDRGVIVMSAGLSAMAGGRPTSEAVDVMRQSGLDMDDHQSRPLTEPIVRHADLILPMTRAHRDAIVAQWPEAAGRVKLLRRDQGDISDPIGGPVDVYQYCADQLKAELEARLSEWDLT